MENYGRAGEATDAMIRRMRFAPLTTEATHTYTHKYEPTICNTYCLSMARKVSRTGLNVTLYVHCLLLLCLSMQPRNAKQVSAVSFHIRLNPTNKIMSHSQSSLLNILVDTPVQIKRRNMSFASSAFTSYLSYRVPLSLSKILFLSFR